MEKSVQLRIARERDIEGIGMGILSDGTAYLNQRGLAMLCGVGHAVIGTISTEWNDDPPKPRISKIKAILGDMGSEFETAHIQVLHKGVVHYCYPAEICLSILEYYALDAGSNVQKQARHNFRILAGSKLRDMIYRGIGYNPMERLRPWLERVELNHQSASFGYFCIFNEAHTVIYALIKAGAGIGSKMVPDISIGRHWAEYWDANDLGRRFGNREKFPHRYPKDHPQARSNPQIANCYPLDALGTYRRWLQQEYLGQGKFKAYLSNNKEISPSVARRAIERLSPDLIK